jgi:hypothetical protein
MGVEFGRRYNQTLILRRPRSGRLEGWAAREIAGKALFHHPLCCRLRGEGYFALIETPRYARLLRVRFLCSFAPMGGTSRGAWSGKAEVALHDIPTSALNGPGLRLSPSDPLGHLLRKTGEARE